MKAAHLAMLAAVAAVPALAIDLVDKGRSRYVISLPAAAIPAEQRAAAELQKFLEQMSGARLPIVRDDQPAGGHMILLGDNAHLERVGARVGVAGLGTEGSVLRTAGRHLVIAGGRPRGTLYGVYALLDKLGCRWYTREVSRIPRMRTIRLGALDETHRPAFEYREPFFTEAFDKEWAARNRTNGDHQELDESTGGRVRYHPFVHSFYELLPPGRYFADHPEYFSLIDGKRRWERGQLCLTNAAVTKLATARVLEWIRQHPDATIFSVSQNDWEGWCECESCRRVEEEEGGEHSGPMLRFVNAVAEEVGKKHPDKLIDTIAYWYTERPPAKVRPLPNVRIRLCPIGVCEAHPYEQCPRSAYFMKNLRAWAAITQQLYIWHYNTNFAHYLLPFPDFDELAADLPMYRRNGVVGVFLEGAYARNGGGENAELRSWVMARQSWDPAVNVDRLVDEFLGAVYGAAAKPLRAYYDLLHAEVRMPPRGRGQHIWIFAQPLLSPDFATRAEALFHDAERAAATGGDAALQARVRQARLPVEYLRLLEAKRYDVRGDTYGPADPGGLRDRFQTLRETLRRFGITSIHEGRDLNTDEQEYAALKPFRVVALENASYRAVAAPEMGGRGVRLIEKRSGRNLLRTPDAAERGYPDVGGLAVTLHADYQARPWPLTWSLEEGGAVGDEIRLVGTAANGLLVRHRMRLTDDGLASEVEAWNPGAGPVEAVVRVSAELDPGDIDAARLRFRQTGGGEFDRMLIEAEREPAGNVWRMGGEVPAGQWRLENPAWRGAAVVQQFEQAHVERAFYSFSAKGTPRAVLALWSRGAALGGGEAVRLRLACRTGVR